MSCPAKLDWRSDLIESFDFIGRTASAHVMPLVAYLALGVFAGLVEGSAFFVNMASTVVYVALASWLINLVWKENGGDDGELAFKHTSPPLLSLVFLEALYCGAGAFLSLLLVLPGIWWAISSCLAIVFVCVEDRGAVDALKRSHELMKGNYKESFAYLAPNVLLVGLGLAAFTYLVKMVSGDIGPLIASDGVYAVFHAGIWLLVHVGNLAARMIMLVCQTKLYLKLKAANASI